MSIKDTTSILDSIKWVLAAILVVAGIAINYYFTAQPAALRLVEWLLLVLLAAGIALRTQKGRDFWQFAVAARNELRKVVWPTRQETTHSTLVVVAMVVIMALVLWGVDSFLLWAISFVTGQRG